MEPDNSQGEYYLTDVVSVLVAAGHRVDAHLAAAEETAGVNDRANLPRPKPSCATGRTRP
ncbi:MAG: hypothetical protein M5U19_10510 [Microthrixaceae bacterium]|nr:hypothetical protein [Microthrixaceae bacterium]